MKCGKRVNRLARHCDDYRLPVIFRKVALQQMLVGKINDNFEVWQSEKMPFE